MKYKVAGVVSVGLLSTVTLLNGIGCGSGIATGPVTPSVSSNSLTAPPEIVAEDEVDEHLLDHQFNHLQQRLGYNVTIPTDFSASQISTILNTLTSLIGTEGLRGRGFVRIEVGHHFSDVNTDGEIEVPWDATDDQIRAHLLKQPTKRDNERDAERYRAGIDKISMSTGYHVYSDHSLSQADVTAAILKLSSLSDDSTIRGRGFQSITIGKDFEDINANLGVRISASVSTEEIRAQLAKQPSYDQANDVTKKIIKSMDRIQAKLGKVTFSFSSKVPLSRAISVLDEISSASEQSPARDFAFTDMNITDGFENSGTGDVTWISYRGSADEIRAHLATEPTVDQREADLKKLDRKITRLETSFGIPIEYSKLLKIDEIRKGIDQLEPLLSDPKIKEHKFTTVVLDREFKYSYFFKNKGAVTIRFDATLDEMKTYLLKRPKTVSLQASDK